MLGVVPGAVGRCYSSKALQLRRSNSVRHRPRTPLPHEINLYIPKLFQVSQRSVSLCLLIPPISSARLGTSSFHGAYKYLSSFSFSPLGAVLSQRSSGRRHTHSSLI